MDLAYIYMCIILRKSFIIFLLLVNVFTRIFDVNTSVKWRNGFHLMEPFLHLRRTCWRRKFMFYVNNANVEKKYINNQFIITQSNRFDHFGVAVNLSRIKYIISHINVNCIPTREVQIRFAEFCPPPVKFSLKMAWLATINLLTKSEVSNCSHYEDMKSGEKCTNWGNSRSSAISPFNIIIINRAHTTYIFHFDRNCASILVFEI